MKPVRFEYERPRDIAAAVGLAQRNDSAAKFIAGGQSLGPMLNLRLVQPDLLVDLTGIAELTHVEQTADAVTLGACVTHADIEDGRVPDIGHDVLRSVAGGIAYRAVRNRGTIGGSVTHADPSADWIACLAALGASVLISGDKGQRTVAVEDFIAGVFENTLAEGELVAAVQVPRLSTAARWGFYKACRKTGEFAHAISAVVCDPARSVLRAVIGAVGARPIVFSDAGALLGGKPNRAGTFDAQVARDALDMRGLTDPIAQQMHVAALRRAGAQAGLL